MGIFDNFNKKRRKQRRENRITRKSRTQKSYPEPDQQIDAIIDNYGGRIFRRGTKAWNNMQGRKTQGKKDLKYLVLHHGIGGTTRALLGPKKSKGRNDRK